MTSDERAIRDLVAAWMAATRAGDTRAILGLMTDDVQFLTPGRAPFGKAEFATASAGLATMKIDGTSEVREVSIEGDLAYAVSYLTVTATPAGGKAVRRSGYALSVLRRGDDRRWRIARDANLLQVDP